MRKGDLVKFKTVVDPGDDEIRMVLREDPDGGRVLVADLIDMTFLPTKVVLVDDIELVDPVEEAQIRDCLALLEKGHRPNLPMSEKDDDGPRI